MNDWQSRSPYYAPQPWPADAPGRTCYRCGEPLVAGQQYIITSGYGDVMHWECYQRRLGR